MRHGAWPTGHDNPGTWGCMKDVHTSCELSVSLCACVPCGSCNTRFVAGHTCLVPWHRCCDVCPHCCIMLLVHVIVPSSHALSHRCRHQSMVPSLSSLQRRVRQQLASVLVQSRACLALVIVYCWMGDLAFSTVTCIGGRHARCAGWTLCLRQFWPMHFTASILALPTAGHAAPGLRSELWVLQGCARWSVSCGFGLGQPDDTISANNLSADIVSS